MKSQTRKKIAYAGIKKNAGFTLLEILLAVFIFALISTGAYQVFSLAQKNALVIQASQERLHDISLSFELLEKDLTQIVARTWRDPYSNTLNPPLQSGTSGDYVLRLVRGGWRNPLGHARSEQQLVIYRLQNDQLQRLYNLHIDNISSTRPLEITLLDKVLQIEFAFIDPRNTNPAAGNSQALTIWPPLNTSLPQNSSPNGTAMPQVTYPLPIAVEITLELEDMGRVSRIIPLATGA